MELFANAEKTLIIAESMAKPGLRITLGGDDLFDAEKMGELDGFDDFRRAIAVRRSGIQQVRMGADAGEREVKLMDHVENGSRMGIQAERRGKTILRAQSGTIMVVREIRIVEAHPADQFKLPPHGRERLDEGEAADFHEMDFCWIEKSYAQPG